MPPIITKISKNTVVPISLGFLFTFSVGLFKLSAEFSKFSFRLESLESRVGQRWNYPMQREFTKDIERLNPQFKAPDVEKIRREHSYN